MKFRITVLKALTLSILFISFQGCLKDDFIELSNTNITDDLENQSYDGFDFATTSSYEISIATYYSTDQPIDGVYVEVYSESPLNESGGFSDNKSNHLVYRGVTDKEGYLTFTASVPVYSEELHVVPYFPGYERAIKVSLDSKKVDVRLQVFSGEAATVKKTGDIRGELPPLDKLNGFYLLGDWSRRGTPDYLVENDVLTIEFLEDVNASLPETSQLPESHPQYLSDNGAASLEIIEDAEVWVTFVHEGAGWQNTLAYYTYPSDSPPSTPEEISNATIVYPNIALESGVLSPGNKVKLLYPDPDKNEFTEVFPAGVSVGWMLIANGWPDLISRGKEPDMIHYSNTNLNHEADAALRKHNVLLWDEARELLLIGFEDMSRENPGCDNDFNDAVFFATSNPVTAIHNKLYEPVDTPVDTDGDGVSDVFDDYPEDPEYSFSNFYPAESKYGSLVFEDLWPYRGDYDFNDLVIDYNFSLETNSENKIHSVRASLVVRAIGASYKNAFGLQIDTKPENIASVSGQRITGEYLEIAENGTEKNQSKAVIIFFDDAFNALPYPGSGVGVNTLTDVPVVNTDTMLVVIKFNEPLGTATIGTPPYNPFIIINKNRDVEIHLPSYPPTDLASEDLFGTGDDNSNPAVAKYYTSDKYLPWAINIPESFDYPLEKEDIRNAYLVFDLWAASLGYSYMDWYQERAGYRNGEKVYGK